MTPTSADPGALVLLDTSAALAYALIDHEFHRTTYGVLSSHARGLAGHAAFETFSVLTRMPAPGRRTPTGAARLLEANFPDTRFLSTGAAADLLRSLPAKNVSGGAVFDALVAAAAVEHGLLLATCDRRALPTYRAVGAELLLL